LARKARRGSRFSKRVISGLAFVCTSLVGGVLSSIGGDLYQTIKSAFSSAFPLSFPQLIFIVIGVIGILLMASGFGEFEKPRAKGSDKKTRSLFPS